MAGLVSSKELIAQSLGISKEQLLPKLSNAIEHPVPPQMTTKAACQEIVETNVDLTKLPIMRYTEKDGGKYIASAVSISKTHSWSRNMCFHRLMLKDKNHFVARIVENRGTDTASKKQAANSTSPSASATQPLFCFPQPQHLPMGVDELGMANALEKTDLVKCKTVDLEVPSRLRICLGRTE